MNSPKAKSSFPYRHIQYFCQPTVSPGVIISITQYYKGLIGGTAYVNCDILTAFSLAVSLHWPNTGTECREGGQNYTNGRQKVGEKYNRMKPDHATPKFRTTSHKTNYIFYCSRQIVNFVMH